MEKEKNDDAIGVVEKKKVREKEFITISFYGETRNIYIDDIQYFDYLNHKITVHYHNHQTFCFYGTLKKIEHELRPFGFLRVHSAYIVNMDHVHSLSRGEITMKNEEKILFSKRRTRELKSKLEEYLKKQE